MYCRGWLGIFLFGIACAGLNSAVARTAHYGAVPQEATWQVEGTRGICNLAHPIPGYGEAVFKRSVDADLVFSVHALRPPKQSAEAILVSIPPQWMHDAETRVLTHLPVVADDDPFFVARDEARRLLLELEAGRFPTLLYADWADGKDQVTVAISAVNFRQALGDFLECITGLLPYGFDSVARTQILFGPGSTELNDVTQHELRRVADYVTAVPAPYRLLIAGYADKKGTRKFNEALARKRARAVKTFLQQAGIPASQMTIQSFGERKAKHSRRAAKSRFDRRVIVTLQK